MRNAILCCWSVLTLTTLTLAAQPPDPATQPTPGAGVWPAVRGEQKPWTRWWWPGNAVDKASLTQQLEQIAAAGFGGVEITPIYGIQGADHREIEFLSPKHMEVLQHAATEAKRLGMQLDMATGTGWPFGGPWVKEADADARLPRNGSALESQPTGMKVKRASPGGAGLVLNPFSEGAMQRYLVPFDDAFAKFPRDLIRSQFHDSFEYMGNFSPDLLDRFKQSRGYDLREQSAAFFGQGDADTVARVKHDYRQTLDEAHGAYMRAWVEWCHKNGWKARNQAHGSPGNLLDLYAGSDIPETETFGSTPLPIPGYRRDERDIGRDSPQPVMARFAASAAHVTGKNLVSCETFTWLREHFKSSLAMMKPEVDQMFLCGINHVLYHGTCFSPADAAWPGWQFYASVEYAPQMPIWRDLPAFNAYVARVQAVLQSGKADNDLLIYWPVSDLWMQAPGTELRLSMHKTDLLLESPFGQLAQRLQGRGYAFDFASDAQLATAAAAGKLNYRAVIVPPCQYLRPETAEALKKLAAGGVPVLYVGAAAPSDVPGFANLADRRAKLAEATRSAKVVAADQLEEALGAAHARREPIAERNVGFIRRAHEGAAEGGHSYFFANLSDKPLDEVVKLADAASAAEMMDPLTGRSGSAPLQSNGVRLQLAPGESILLRTFTNPVTAERRLWQYREPAGDVVALTGTWDVNFTEGGPALPPPLKLDKLISWADAGGEETERFSGAARYRLEFDAPPAAQAGARQEWLLDLGDVRESARVSLNGRPVGTLWSLPFRVTLDGRHLKPARNLLEVEVTNLAANRVRDLDRRGVKWRIMKEINFVNIGYRPFDASSWDVTPSGLLGPVTLTPMRPAGE
ncbi:MAG TPA: glycosyl hydrolase [Tepidisphaeraceae bacterium]|nr:glycosyl hydrolase [Tepidisphaeraceae bacterium]